MNGNESERKEYRETKPNFDEKSDEIVDLQYYIYSIIYIIYSFWWTWKQLDDWRSYQESFHNRNWKVKIQNETHLYEQVSKYKLVELVSITFSPAFFSLSAEPILLLRVKLVMHLI